MSEVGRDGELVKWIPGVMCMHRLNFGKQEVSRTFHAWHNINRSLLIDISSKVLMHVC